MARQYGDIVYLRVGARHDYLLNHPDYIQQVLLAHGMIRLSARPLRHLLGQGVLTTTGEVHRGQRRVVAAVVSPPARGRVGRGHRPGRCADGCAVARRLDH